MSGGGAEEYSMDKRKKFRNVKRCIIIAAVVLLVLTLGGKAYAGQGNTIDKLIDNSAGSHEAKSIGKQVDKYGGDGLEEILGDYDPEDIVGDIAKGNVQQGFSAIAARVGDIFLGELRKNMGLLLRVMVIVILCAVLERLRGAFLKESTGEIAFFVSYIILVSVLMVSFKEISMMGIRIIDQMVDFMYATSPILITLLVSGGNIAAGSIVQPIVILVVEVAATMMKNVLIPLVMIATVAAVIDNISEKIKISRIAVFLRKLCTWSIGIILTVFATIIAIQGSVSAVADGIAGKSVKFVIGAVPVVGSYLSEAADTVIGCTLLVKNAAGIAAMMGVIGICILPIMKIGSMVLMYRFAGILTEPVSDKRISRLFDEMGKSLVMVFAIVVSVSVMFIITITAIIGASNISAMIR